MRSAAVIPSLTARTERLDTPPELIPLADASAPAVWLTHGDGLVGVGEAVRLEFHGPDRFAEASRAWRRLVETASVDDEVRLAGTGLVALGTFAFADDSRAASVLVVPDVVVGRRDGVAWLTRIGANGYPTPHRPVPTPFGAECRVSFVPGAMSRDGYRAAVAEARRLIRGGGLDKVVLARDGVGRLPADADVRRAIAALAAGYPGCWTFAVDGMTGASPETLVRVEDGVASARVLAGTAPRGADATADKAVVAGLMSSEKDRDEHRLAVASLTDALSAHATDARVDGPFALELPNLWHLATDVSATLAAGASSLDLLGLLHPTAAVAGTPRAAAVDLIRRLEPFDRGRYAGPVGWVGADGEGEWAIALRSAQVEADGTLTEYAGAGIVAGSDPDRELAETSLKFRPVVQAFA